MAKPSKPSSWVDKILPPAQVGGKGGLPSLDLRGLLPVLPQPKGKPGALPNASLIYGIAAAALLGVALYSIVTGNWVRGLLVLLPAGTFWGFALYYLRYPS